MSWGALCPAVAVLFLSALAGCGDGWGMSRRDLPDEPTPQAEGAPDMILKDTIGEKIVLAGAGPLRVRGFGLVIGLGDEGTTECPAALRDHLIEKLTKTYELDAVADGGAGFSATKLVDSPKTAPVQIDAFIPAGTPRGERFDVYVQAATGTQTRSLAGGLLLPCELKIVDLAYRGDRLIAGRAVAQAAGPVFINPYVDQDESGSADPRRGFILGGGSSSEPRNMRLVMTNPSYADTRRIEMRINERFGQSPKTAEAMGEGHVEVRTPAGYSDDPMRFIQLVSHVYLLNQPEIYEEKLRDMASLAEQPTPPYNDLALAWEAIGRIGVNQIQPFYGHANRETSFAAAQAGLRLGDFKALGVMGQIAGEADHPRRIDAIYELGRTPLTQAARFLVPLLDSTVQEVRIAAYKALIEQNHPAVETRVVRSTLDPNAVNFYLDIVASSAEPMIYIRRTGAPRIAIFGHGTPCMTPLFYSHPDGWVTLNAIDADGDITLFRRTRSGQLSDSLIVSPRVVDLILSMADLPIKDENGNVRGVGLGYSQVVYVLHALKRESIIPTAVVVEASGLEELIQRDETPERPEGDLPSVKKIDADGASTLQARGDRPDS
jgi:hypothetical protein